jgi:betaine-aldehyde dehydrogenase
MTERAVARHWIGGEWADAARTPGSVNPGTGKVIGSYADARVGQAAIDAAARTFAT